jgi:hypothetical protein
MFPEGSWNEILTDDDLLCEDTQARNYEHTLRSNIYWHDVIADDAAQECRFYVWPSFDLGSYGAEPTYSYGEDRGSYRWEHPLQNLDEDFKLLSMPEPVYDREETQRRLDAANDVFGGILEVTLRRNLDGWTLGMTSEVIRLIGLDNLFLYMYDNPDGLHRLMAFMRDAKLKLLDTYDMEEGLMPPNDRDGYTGSGGQAYTHDFDCNAKSPLMRCWGFAESQETMGVSPGMFNEFVFQYQLPLLERVIQETLRLYPPIHMSNRLAARDLEFAGRRIPAGTRVLFSIFLTQRHPRWWPEPARFEPERFNRETTAPPAPFTYLPFGAGPRFCLGAVMAQVEMKVVLARLLQCFDFDLVSPAVGWRMGATLEPHGLRMRVRRRPIRVRSAGVSPGHRRTSPPARR